MEDTTFEANVSDDDAIMIEEEPVYATESAKVSPLPVELEHENPHLGHDDLEGTTSVPARSKNIQPPAVCKFGIPYTFNSNRRVVRFFNTTLQPRKTDPAKCAEVIAREGPAAVLGIENPPDGIPAVLEPKKRVKDKVRGRRKRQTVAACCNRYNGSLVQTFAHSDHLLA